ncbi:MAG: rRNA maturation RNase YbeY [Spirochaetes bacterium]|nr:MAG: rRNA maturation RNase YbeY [Spirochaetota bacterium]
MGKARHEVYAESVKLPFHGIAKRTIAGWLGDLCARIGIENATITVILVTDARIRGINREYRKKDKPTDVISFAYRDEPFPGPSAEPEALGDVYISLERVESQAERFGVTPVEEFRRLLVHGVLHLAGFDHERSRRDAGVMRKKEEELLSSLPV